MRSAATPPCGRHLTTNGPGRIDDSTRPADIDGAPRRDRGRYRAAWRRPRRSSRSAAARSRSPIPQKVYFPDAGLHEARPRPLLPRRRRRRAGRRPRPADGAQALRGRDRQGAVLPEAGAGQHARLDPDRRADVPVRAGRPTRSSSTTPRPRLDRQPRLHRPQPAPGPGRRPRPSRRAARRPRPGARRRLAADPRRRDGHARRRSRPWGSSAGRRRPGSRGIHINVRIERRWTYPEVRRAALALARDVERARARDRDLEVVEGGAPRRLPRLQPERQGPDGRLGLLRPAAARRARLDAAVLGRGADRRGRGVHDRDGAGAVRRDRRPRAPGIDDAVGSLEALLELSRQARGARARATRRGRRTTRKQAGEPPRVQPSRKRRPDAGVRHAVAARPAARRRRSPRSEQPPSPPATANAGLPTEWEGSRPTPTGRRKTNVPVIEISRAASKAEALEGLERWKARHPEAATRLEPADVLVDGMRGRSSLWYRVRVNLTHVPEADRPPQETARPRLRPVGRLRVAGPGRPARARAAQAGAELPAAARRVSGRQPRRSARRRSSPPSQRRATGSQARPIMA